jgi:hypothetical protein
VLKIFVAKAYQHQSIRYFKDNLMSLLLFCHRKVPFSMNFHRYAWTGYLLVPLPLFAEYSFFADRKCMIFILFCIFLCITGWLKYNKYDQTVFSIHMGLLIYASYTYQLFQKVSCPHTPVWILWYLENILQYSVLLHKALFYCFSIGQKQYTWHSIF